MHRMITRERAEAILATHGTTPNKPQVWWPEENQWDPTSSFDDEVGIKGEYELMEVLGFLGYCCPWC